MTIGNKAKVVSAMGAAMFTVAALTTSPAQARVDAYRMTCPVAKGFVRSEGAVVLNTGPRTYARAVASRNFCPADAPYTERLTIRTIDRNSCFIGFRCTSQEPFLFDD